MDRAEAQELGRRGEDWVRRILERRGLEILAANWRCPYGEIDLIAATEEELLFVEVKTRRSDRYSTPAEAVDRRKRRNLICSAQQWLAEHPQEMRQPRFDVAEVLAPQGVSTKRPTLHYIENAFMEADADESTCF